MGDLDVDARFLIADSGEATGQRQLDKDDFGKEELVALQATAGASGDASSANTLVGLLKAVKASVAASATDAVLQAVRDRLPTGLSGGRLVVEASQQSGTTFSVNGVAAAASGSEAAALTQPDTTARKIVNANSSRRKVTLTNAGSVTVYLGYDSSVTTSTGTPLLAGQSATERDTQSAIYGITAGGTGDIRVLEV